MPEASGVAFGLPVAACDRIVSVLRDYPEIVHATIFGSRAKGNFRPGSDIDLCLDAPALSAPRRLALEDRLDDLLLPWKIDLLVRNEIDNPALLEHIARVGRELFVQIVR
jgi:predicted nucleotidyltransferase